MKSNHLGSEKILAVGNALRDVDDLVALVVDYHVRCPLPVA